MYVASASTEIQFHEIFNQNLAYTYQSSLKPVNKIGPCKSISWAKGGHWLAAVSCNGLSEIISIKNNSCKLIQTVPDVTESTCASFPNLTKRLIAIGTIYGHVLLYDVKLRNVRQHLISKKYSARCVGYVAKDTHLYVGHDNGDISLFNNSSKRLVSTFKIPDGNSLTCLQAHAQKQNYLVGGNSDGIVAVFNTNLSKRSVKFLRHAHDAPVSATVFSPVNTSLIVTAGNDRQVCVYDIDNQQRITCISMENSVTSLDFAHDSIHIIMGSQNGKIHLYDTRNFKKAVHSYQAHQTAIRHLAVQKSCEPSSKTNICVSNTSSVGSTDVEQLSVPTTVSTSSEVKSQSSGEEQTSQFFKNLIINSSDRPDVASLSNAAGLKAGSAGDSFLQALGLNASNTPTFNDGDKHESREYSRHLSPNVPNNFSPFVSKELRNLCDSTLMKNFASTPKTVALTVPTTVPITSTVTGVEKTAPVTFMSPIISQSYNNKNYQFKSDSNVISNFQSIVDDLKSTLISDMKNTIKEVVQEQVKQVIEKQLFDLRYKMYLYHDDEMRLIKNTYFDLTAKFCDIKKSVKETNGQIVTDNNVNREQLQQQHQMQQFFLEENRQLRLKVAQLEKQLAELETST